MHQAERILRDVRQGNFRFSLHAQERSLQRSLSHEQVVQVAHRILHWKWQEKEATYLFVGTLEDEQGAGFTAVLEDGVVVVTVFKRKLKRWEKTKAKEVN